VFLDTPGIHRSGTLFNKRMMETVRAALDGRDLLLFLIDASLPFEERDRHAVDLVKKSETPAFAVFNKVDLLKDKAALLPLIDIYRELHAFAEYVPVSALAGDGLEVLKRLIVARLPEGPAYFPEDHLTDQPERFLAAELIREKILHLTRQEVPHAVAVTVDAWKESAALTRIQATVWVEKEGQKAILIGSGGSMMKKIGAAARMEIESLLARKVFLELFVKVRPGWRENAEFLNTIDWRTTAGREAGES
jgi:GTP-binding protein Era